jgi:hypothetical protein
MTSAVRGLEARLADCGEKTETAGAGRPGTNLRAQRQRGPMVQVAPGGAWGGMQDGDRKRHAASRNIPGACNANLIHSFIPSQISSAVSDCRAVLQKGAFPEEALPEGRFARTRAPSQQRTCGTYFSGSAQPHMQPSQSDTKQNLKTTTGCRAQAMAPSHAGSRSRQCRWGQSIIFAAIETRENSRRPEESKTRSKECSLSFF